MIVAFTKYHGTGNDFILIDNREKLLADNLYELFKKLCDRRFGIGADGLMLLQDYEGLDFEMKYYNADGNESTMCGNGGRCIAKYAQELGIVKDKATFAAIDGIHEAILEEDGTVNLKMNDVATITEEGADFVLDTGSPHYVQFRDDVDDIDVFNSGKRIRDRDAYKAEGINVNFVNLDKDKLIVRTYERGVEDETYSCGTGVVASAMAAANKYHLSNEVRLDVETLGGKLTVRFDRKNGDGYRNVWLKGPAKLVYRGEVDITAV